MSVRACVVVCLVMTVVMVADSSDSFQQLLKHEAKTVLTQEDFTQLTEHLLEKFSCPSDNCQCLLSLDLTTLFTLANADPSGVTSDTYGRLSVILVYYIYNTSRCTTTPPAGVTEYSMYEDWLVSVMTNPDGLDQGLYTLFAGLRHGYSLVRVDEELVAIDDGHAGDQDDDNSSDDEDDRHPDNNDNHGTEAEECLDQRKINRLINMSGSTVDGAIEAAGWIILDLVKGLPLAHSCNDLPYPDDILQRLWSRVGGVKDQPITVQVFESVLRNLSIGTIQDDGNGDTHDERRRKRSTSMVLGHTRYIHSINRRDVSQVTPQQTCYNAAQLLDIYNINAELGVASADLTRLCPALIHQQLTNACQSHEEEEEHPEITTAQKYGYGTLSVFIISLAAMLGIFLAPCMKSKVFHYIMSYMVALAVGTLVGDAMLHLIPQAFGLHGHEGEHENEESDEGTVIQPFIFKSLGMLAAMYLFLILQTALEWGSKTKSTHHGHTHGELTDMEKATATHTQSNGTTPSDYDCQGKQKDKGGCCGGVQSVGWMIVVGDGVHNFADGLAIGAAFSVDIWSGISTSLAVLCHEIPHELGDFAILLNAGMSLKRALLLNMLSAMMAFGGLYVGLSIAVNVEVRLWIFSIAGGMFLYLALANMVPELMIMQTKGNRALMFFMQNLGFLMGVGLLLVIAIFEEEIEIES